MGKIKQMPEALANQIAAGEVVERPASVVKELVENSIDAGSDEIIIELEEAGIQLVKVTDNGEGMDQEDLRSAFLPHATSKIYDRKDLFEIASLGFRGEALASIGSVAKVRVESTPQGHESGNFIVIEGSQVVDEGISSGRQGTMITVESLFYNTPARLKHLKTIQTELSHSIRLIQNMALAYPQIRFRLSHNQQVIFNSHGNNNLQQAIASVYQPSLARDLVRIEGENSDFKIHGYISKPTLTRTSKRYIHWMINGRPVKSYMLDQVLLKAYGRQLMIGRYPISVVHVELDPRLVDVNVHPTKQTVRLSKEEELSDLLTHIIQETLASIDAVPKADLSSINSRSGNQGKAEDIPLDFHQSSDAQEASEKSRRQHLRDALYPDPKEAMFEAKMNRTHHRYRPDPTRREDMERDSREENSQERVSPGQYTPSASTSVKHQIEETTTPLQVSHHAKINFQSLRYVGQIHGTYLIAESAESFFLIDQHAAQERIRYEAFMGEDYPIDQQQGLLIPEIFKFPADQEPQIEEILPSFARLGIHLENFGPATYKLDAYPSWIESDELNDLIYDLAESLVDEPNQTIQELKEASIIMKSCRGAIKANHYLDEQQAKALIIQLDDLEDPYHCPHGRPVLVEFTEKNLEKLFKRIQDAHEGGVVR